MNLIEIFTILIIHWFADFVCQTDEQAKNKSKDSKFLTQHVKSYTLIWTVCLFIYSIILSPSTIVLLFIPVTFICHWITDYCTSRVNSKLWAKGNVHTFFVSIGFDQLLHYIQLFTTYYLLK